MAAKKPDDHRVWPAINSRVDVDATRKSTKVRPTDGAQLRLRQVLRHDSNSACLVVPREANDLCGMIGEHSRTKQFSQSDGKGLETIQHENDEPCLSCTAHLKLLPFSGPF